MFLLEWYREFLEIRYESKQRKVQVHKEVQECLSCETLRKQLEIANYEKGQLLTKLLKEPEPPKETIAPAITPPKTIPWAVRKQLLEREDREKAQLMRNVPKPLSEPVMTEKEEIAIFEKELDNASAAREK